MVALARRIAAMAVLAGALAVPQTAAAAQPPGCAPERATGGEWRGYGKDLANSRHQDQEKVIAPGDVATLQTAWSFSTVAAGGAGDITGTPTVVDGCMYVATTRGWVFAVNADTGKPVWKAKLPYGGSVNSSVNVVSASGGGGAAARRKAARGCRRCVSRRKFAIRLPRKVRGSRVVSARVKVGKRRAKAFRGGRRLRSRINLRGLPRGRFTVRIVLRTANGKTVVRTRRYRTCVPKRQSTRKRRTAAQRRAAAKRRTPAQRRRAAQRARREKACARRAAQRRRAARRRRANAKAKQSAAPAPRRAGTVYVSVTRTQEQESCPPGDPCVGPYAVALDQATGNLVWASRSIDDQPGADSYGSPVLFDGILLMGVSGGSAELGDEADRYAFQGSMNFLDASTGRLMKKTYTIHPPMQPDDDFAGAGIWSTPSVDAEDKVAFAGTANPFKPQAEHEHSNAVVKFDLDTKSPRFGEIIDSYKGNIDEYVPGLSELPCYDFPGNNPPFYPQGIGSCGDIDLDFGASANLFRDKDGRKLVGVGQKSGVYHVFDAKTMDPVWSQVVGPPGAFGGVVGSTAHDGSAVYGPITVPGYVWSISSEERGRHRWIGPIADGMHWGPPVASANGVIYTVDFSGYLDAFDARTGVLLAKRPLALGGSSPVTPSWAGVSVARNTIYAAVGVLGLADGFVVAYRPGGVDDVAKDVTETGTGGAGGGAPETPAGPSILAGPGAASTGYATPAMATRVGGPLSFMNLDVVQHDVVSVDKGPTGLPLFSTPLIGLGETAEVQGLENTQSGKSYEFFCTLHPGMRGELAVQ